MKKTIRAMLIVLSGLWTEGTFAHSDNELRNSYIGDGLYVHTIRDSRVFGNTVRFSGESYSLSRITHGTKLGIQVISNLPHTVTLNDDKFDIVVQPDRDRWETALSGEDVTFERYMQFQSIMAHPVSIRTFQAPLFQPPSGYTYPRRGWLVAVDSLVVDPFSNISMPEYGMGVLGGVTRKYSNTEYILVVAAHPIPHFLRDIYRDRDIWLIDHVTFLGHVHVIDPPPDCADGRVLDGNTCVCPAHEIEIDDVCVTPPRLCEAAFIPSIPPKREGIPGSSSLRIANGSGEDVDIRVSAWNAAGESQHVEESRKRVPAHGQIRIDVVDDGDESDSGWWSALVEWEDNRKVHVTATARQGETWLSVPVDQWCPSDG